METVLQVEDRDDTVQAGTWEMIALVWAVKDGAHRLIGLDADTFVTLEEVNRSIKDKA
mgnify:CR=1 FL=1